ncbi:MAG: SHOCT domain-containing protein [Comamonadaceae bacterium]|nr:SHOCT domain-containing protein [Comamonadaceae bacterium]
MGQFILFLLALFAIGCVLYGISAGVQMIQRGFAWLAESGRDDASDKKPLVTPLPPSMGKAANAPASQREAIQPQTKASPQPADASPMRRGIDELRDIFALYQQGALTQVEFERMKRSLLTDLKSAAPQGQ